MVINADKQGEFELCDRIRPLNNQLEWLYHSCVIES